MRIDLLTLFPGMFEGVLSESIIKRARQAGIVEVFSHDMRNHGIGRHRQVDDTPYGGGPGMVLRPEPVIAAIRETILADAQTPRLVMMTPQGRVFDQSVARSFAQEGRLLVLCGHYEGYDERIRLAFDWDEISIGDFILTGGEIPAMALLDAVVRLLPGALGDDSSPHDESFERGLLEYPHYTRPRVFEDMAVPEVLLNGHHREIEEWRRAQAEERTRLRRPDLWNLYQARESGPDESQKREKRRTPQ